MLENVFISYTILEIVKVGRYIRLTVLFLYVIKEIIYSASVIFLILVRNKSLVYLLFSYRFISQVSASVIV